MKTPPPPKPDRIPLSCGACGAVAQAAPTKKGNARLPRGWKECADPETGEARRYCKDCWKRLYRLRAVSFPVQGVQEGGSWKDFCAAVRLGMFRSRTLAQWAVNQLAATDVSRTLEMDALPPHPPLGRGEGVYLYGLASLRFADWGQWAGAYTCAQSVLRNAELKYNGRRSDIVWTAEASLPTIRSCPYPVPAQNWSAEYAEYTNEETGQTSRVPAVRVPLGGHRWLLRLRGGRRRARQLGAFAQIVSGAAVQCELALYRKRKNDGDHRGGDRQNGGGGGARVKYDIMVKLVAWLPREEREGKKRDNGPLIVQSTKRAFLMATHEDFERPWMLNRDEVRQRIFGHAARLQRINEDTVAELRPYRNPPGPWSVLSPEQRQDRRRYKRARKRRQGFLDRIAKAYDDYLGTKVKEMAAWLASYADRLDVSKIVLDLSEHGYCPGFRWAALAARIESVCTDLSPPIVVEVAPATASENENNGANGSDQTSGS